MNATSIAATIYNQFEIFRTRDRNSGLRMVPILVDIASESLAQDLERFETFHDSDNSELHKQAAFLVYWLSKVKPIAIQPFQKHTKYITVNEYFAFLLAMRLLDINIERISDSFTEEFVYSLYYRDTSPKQMFYTFMMLDRLNKAVSGNGKII